MNLPESKNSKPSKNELFGVSREKQKILEKYLVKGVSKTAAYMLLEMFFRSDHAVLSFAKMRQDGVTRLTQKDIDQVRERAIKSNRELVIHVDTSGMSLGFSLFQTPNLSDKLSEGQSGFYAQNERKNKVREMGEHLRLQVSQIPPIYHHSIAIDTLNNPPIEYTNDSRAQNV